MSVFRTLKMQNIPYLKQQFSALLRNFGLRMFITSICLITLFGYLLSFSETLVRALSVTPGYMLPSEFRIWTAFTFCFIELHFWEVLVDLVTVGLCGKLLEPLWGQMEMFKFFALTNFGVVFCTTIYYLFYYMCTKNEWILFGVHIHGLAGYVAGITVAVRQIMPDHLIFKTRYGKLINRNLPLTVAMITILFWAINLLDGTYPAMFCSGLIVSWVYLRFYQPHTNGRGDSSESFTFASFFPNVMQPFIGVLVNPLYVCCLKIGFVRPPAPPRTISTSSLTSIAISMPGVDPHDIERRKQIALKALSERLKTTNDSARANATVKSFPAPVLPVANFSYKHNHQHHHHHPYGHSHSHQHRTHQDHHHHHHSQNVGGDITKTTATTTPAFHLPSTAQIAAPITTARAEPRMISTMSPIAIPMPPPPSKAVNLGENSIASSTSEVISVEADEVSTANG